MRHNRPLAYHYSLRPETVAAISRMPLLAQQIADRWILGSAAKTRLLEAEGVLVDRLREQYELERAALDRAAGDDYAHLADHEKLELLGPPPGP
jgi:hypothetical protein